MASKDQTAAEIMAAVAVELDWNSLIDDLTSALGSEAGRSARAAIQALQEQGALPAERATLATLFDSVDAAGLKYAQERGAELVGMRAIRDENGFITSIVRNPNPEWAITETTRERLRDLVGQAIDGGWASSKLREEIYHSEDFSNYRASMIARSEIDMAHLEGQHNAALGSEMKSKRWLKADSAVCDDCEEMANEVVAIDEPFSSGTMTTYLHPHDRCTAEYLPGEPEEYEDDGAEKLAKGSEDQPRDERGRWGSGDTVQVNSPGHVLHGAKGTVERVDSKGIVQVKIPGGVVAHVHESKLTPVGLKKDFDESQHPRDERGRWGSGGEGHAKEATPNHDLNAKMMTWVKFGPEYAALKNSSEFAAQLRALPQAEGTMWRGAAMSSDELAAFKPGEVFRFEQNASATARDDDWSERMVGSFADKPFVGADYEGKTEAVVLKLEGASGADLGVVGATSTMLREAVIPIGESFDVLRVERGLSMETSRIKDGQIIKKQMPYTRVTLRGTHGDGSLRKTDVLEAWDVKGGAWETGAMRRMVEADSGLRPIGLSRLQKYSEDQPRDENGRFSGGGDMSVKLSEMSPDKAEAERGRLRAVHARQREARAVAREKAKDSEASRQGLLRAQRAYANERTPEALRANRDTYFGDRPIVMTGEVGNLFASEFRTAYDALPQRVRDTVMGAGVAVVAANQSVAEAVPRLTNEQPRGYEAGRTFKNVDGVFCPSERVAVVAARTVDGENNRVAGALRHEVGHAYDFAYATHTDQGWATDTPQFKVAYARDLDHIDAHPDFNGFTHAPAGYDPAKDFNSGKAWEPTPARTIAEGRIGYYLQRSDAEKRAGEMNGAAGRQEAFAEVFAQLHGTGSTRVDLLQYFPHMTKAIKEYVDTGEIK